MKCPILAPTPDETRLGKLWDAVDCLKEECAVWDKAYDRCGILSMGIGLDMVDKRLYDLTQKMPHEGQFRK